MLPGIQILVILYMSQVYLHEIFLSIMIYFYVIVLLMKAIAGGSFGVNMFLSGDQYKRFVPMLEILKSFGISGPNGMLHLYYLACWHEFSRSSNTGACNQQCFCISLVSLC